MDDSHSNDEPLQLYLDEKSNDELLDLTMHAIKEGLNNKTVIPGVAPLRDKIMYVIESAIMLYNNHKELEEKHQEKILEETRRHQRYFQAKFMSPTRPMRTTQNTSTQQQNIENVQQESNQTQTTNNNADQRRKRSLSPTTSSNKKQKTSNVVSDSSSNAKPSAATPMKEAYSVGEFVYSCWWSNKPHISQGYFPCKVVAVHSNGAKYDIVYSDDGKKGIRVPRKYIKKTLSS